VLALRLDYLEPTLAHERLDVAVPVAAPSLHVAVEAVLLPPREQRPVAHAVLEEQDRSTRLAHALHLAQRLGGPLERAQAERVDDRVERAAREVDGAGVDDGKRDARAVEGGLSAHALRHLPRRLL